MKNNKNSNGYDLKITPQMIQQSTTVECSNPECKNPYFIPVQTYRKIPGLLLGQKEDVLIPIPAVICSHCGTPLKELDPLEE